MAKRTVTFGGHTFEIDDSKRNDTIKDIANNGYYDYSTVAKERASLTEAQVEALGQALAVNASKRQESIGMRPDDTAYAQYIQAIKELTDENGKVNYDPDGYQFNPYTNGRPDEMAQKAFDSLSYKDQLMLAIAKNGKPDTPDFGDPNVDTSVYDRYQQALLRVEEETKQEANAKATKAMEDLYKQHRGSWDYDPAKDAKALKAADKNISLTQTELEDIYNDLASLYDWDDDAYNAWANPEQVVAEEKPESVEKKNEKKFSLMDTVAGVVNALPGKAALDVAKAQYEAGQAAVAATYSDEEIAQATKERDDFVRARGVNAFQKAFNKLTGKDTVEYYLAKNRKDGSFTDDAKYVVNQAIQGIGDFVSGVATLAGLATKAQIDTALAPAWFITNEGKRWTMEEAREKFGVLDTIMDIADTAGSGANNAYNQAGMEKASGTAQFIGGLARAFTSSMTSGIAGGMLGQVLPKMTATVDLSVKLGSNAPKAVQTLAKLVPQFNVGINQGPFLTQAFGSGYQSAKAEGYDETGALIWGSWTALAEGVPESVSWNWSSATGSSLKSKVYGGLRPDAAKAATRKGLKNLMSKVGSGGALQILTAMNAEGMEEVISNYLEWFGRKTILDQDVDAPAMRDLVTTYASGALLSAITQGFSYATSTPARKQAETIVDGMMNGQTPTAEQVQALDDANNEEAAKLPLSNEQIETAVGNGLRVDEKIVTAYRTVNNELTTAEKRATDALHNLQQMNANGVPFGDPTRVAAVKAFTDARKDIVALASKRAATHAKYLGALDGMIQDTEAALAEVEAAQQHAQQEYAQWQVDEMLATDPQGLMTATQELQSAVNEELVALKTELKQNGMMMDIGTRTAMMQRVNALGESAVKLQQMADAAYAAVAPTIAEQPTSEDDGANTPPKNGTPVQAIPPDIEEQAQGHVATMRQHGATTEEIIRSVEEQAAAEEADETDAAFAEAVKAIVSTNTPSLAQTLIANNASTASEKTITDLLNRARQEGTDEAGIALARELLMNSGTVDNSADVIKTALRNMNIAPTAEERANIAATYGSYDTYRRAVAGVVPLGGVGKQGSVSIDQAIGALQQDFPGQVTGDDRAAWLYDFAQNNPKGRINYDGNLDVDSAQLWGEIKADNASFFGSKDVAPSFAVPDFANKETMYGKQAAADWLDQTHKAGTADADIAAYAGTRKLTGTTAKERAFWENVEGAMAQTRNGKPKVMAFKPTPQQETQGDVVKVLDETSPYMQADSTDMKHASSTYPTVRKLASIKNDIQNTLGFRYSDEHFIRAQRKAGAVAYYEPTGRFVVSDDTNNLPAFLHEAGHHMALDQYNEDEVNAFKQNVPRKFLDEYPEGAQAQEAGAEMFRAWMMNPESMERNYPETFDAMRKALGQSKYNRLRDESAAVRKWMDADVEKRVSSTQVTAREQEKARKKNFAWSDFIKKEADAEYGYKKLDRIMQRNGVTLAAGADARAACARTSSEAIHALMFDGMYDPKTGQKVEGSLTETTRGLIVTAEDKQTLEVYLELKQSLDRYEKNNKDWTFSRNVCTPAEAKAYVESVENNKKNVVDAAKNLWKWLEKYRHTQLSGAIPQSVIDEWDTLNPHYIPQTRVFTDNVRAAVRGGKTGDGTGVNRRKVGSTRDFLSPIDAIVQMVAKTKTAAMKHETLLALQEYYDAGEAYAGDFLHEVEPGVHITPVDGLTVTKAAVNALERGGMDAETLQQVNDLLDGNSPETRMYRYGAPNGRNNNIVAITQDGHTRYFEVRDQDLMDAIAPMNKQQLGSFLTAVSKVNRQISALITSKNPLFAGSNAIRDFVTGYAFGSTKNPIKYVGNYVSAARDVAKNTDAARQYRAMGGGGGLAQSFANADQVNDVTAAMFGRSGDDRNAVKRALDTVGNKLDEFNGGIETIPRLAEYKRQLEKGASYAEAIKAAKNLTTDFSTGGTHSKIMNTLWRFYGAQVNGLYKTFNLFADKNNTEQTKKDFNKTIGAISGIAVAGALWHFALHLLDDEDEYAALPDYIKDDYYIIPYGGGKFVRIPKPNDPLLVALDSMSRNIADAALRIQPGVDAGDVVKEEGVDLLGDIASILLPFGDWNKANPLGSNFVGAPVMQWAYNKTWTGADIVPSYMEDVSPALQYDDKTSWVSRQLGKVFNISPMKLDNLFDQSSGVIGEVVDAFSAGVDAAEQGGIVKGVGAGLKEALLSRFLVDSAYSQNVTGGFYDAKDELTQFIEDVERNIDMENLPYSPMMKNLGPSETNAAYKEAKNMTKKINDLTKTLSDIGKQATQYTQQGNEEKARDMKYKQQELAAEASLIIAAFFDKWNNQ